MCDFLVLIIGNYKVLIGSFIRGSYFFFNWLWDLVSELLESDCSEEFSIFILSLYLV